MSSKSNLKDRIKGIYLVCDNSICPSRSHLEIARSALKGGVRIIQLRAKNLAVREVYEIAKKMALLCRRHNAIFIVNDYIEIALATNADGVHLGQDDLPIEVAKRLSNNSLIIGASTHSLRQAIDAEKKGADYVAFGSIYHTSSKEKPTAPQGLKKLKKVVDVLSTPVVAIGGITAEKIPQIKETNVSAVAMISEIVCAPSITRKAKELTLLWNKS